MIICMKFQTRKASSLNDYFSFIIVPARLFLTQNARKLIRMNKLKIIKLTQSVEMCFTTIAIMSCNKLKLFINTISFNLISDEFAPLFMRNVFPSSLIILHHIFIW